jgi:hypothetical protein
MNIFSDAVFSKIWIDSLNPTITCTPLTGIGHCRNEKQRSGVPTSKSWAAQAGDSGLRVSTLVHVSGSFHVTPRKIFC